MTVKINYQTKGFVEWGKSYKDLYDDILEWRRENSFIDKDLEHMNICRNAD